MFSFSTSEGNVFFYRVATKFRVELIVWVCFLSREG